MSTVGTYAADLWDKFQELIAKMVRAKASIKELQVFMKTQMELEQKMAQFYTKQGFTMKDMGEFENPLKSMLEFCKAMGAQHQQTFNQCNQQLTKELMDIRKQLSKSIKAAIKQEAKLSSDFKSAIKAMHSAREKEISEKKNFEQLQAKLKSGSEELLPKQMQKLQNTVHQAEKSAENAEKNYKAAVAKQKVVRNDYYQKLALLMASLEQLDRKRVKTVSQILDKYSLLHEASWQATEKGVEKMKAVFLLIDEEREIQNFVKANKTGQQPPPPEEFVPYVVSVPDELKGNAPSGSRSISLGQAPMSDSFRKANDFPADSGSKKSANTGEILKVVRATYEYIPEDPENELALHEGDIIEVLEMDDEAGWWMGRIKTSNEPGAVGKKGFFPSNFCGDPQSEETETPADPPASSSEVCLATVKALYPFSSSEPGELNFNEGDIIHVYHKGDDGWWEGESKGKRGTFPSNYTDAPDAPKA